MIFKIWKYLFCYEEPNKPHLFTDPEEPYLLEPPKYSAMGFDAIGFKSALGIESNTFLDSLGEDYEVRFTIPFKKEMS